MKKKIIISCIFIMMALIIGATIVLHYLDNKIVYNNPDATGNTAGNLNNGGLFCEYEGKIYFANPYDLNKLYCMNSDCTDARKLNDDSVASLNVCGKYIIYVRNNTPMDAWGMLFKSHLSGIYRSNLDGTHVKPLYDGLSGIAALAGNTVFYQHYDNDTALSLYRVGIDGKDNKKVYDTPYTPSSIKNGRIYFSDPQNKHGIAYIDTKTNKAANYYESNSYMATVEGNYAYYIDMDKNYALVRLNTSNKTLELLYSPPNGGKVINYNIYDNKIFFQVEGEATGLYRMNIDGTQVEYLASGDITCIHCTSEYTFFSYYQDPTKLYRVPTTSAVKQVEEIVIH